MSAGCNVKPKWFRSYTVASLLPWVIAMLCFALVTGCAATQKELPDLVAHYPLDEGHGVLAQDLSPLANPALIDGPAWVKNDAGAVLDFNGSMDHVNCDDQLPTRVRGPLTISVWVRPRYHAVQDLVSRVDWNLKVIKGKPVFSARRAPTDKWGAIDKLQAKQALPLDKWSLVTAVYDTERGVMELFINAELSNSRPKTDGRIGGIFRSKMYIGKRFNGLMRDCRVYRRAFSADEIQTLCETTRPDPKLATPAFRLRMTPYLFYREKKLHAQMNLYAPAPADAVAIDVSCCGMTRNWPHRGRS